MRVKSSHKTFRVFLFNNYSAYNDRGKFFFSLSLCYYYHYYYLPDAIAINVSFVRIELFISPSLFIAGKLINSSVFTPTPFKAKCNPD